MEDLKKLLAAATPGPWTHASDKLAAGNIKAPDNAALIVAAVNALPELLAIRDAARTALGHLDDPTGGDEIDDMRRASDVLRAALNQETKP